MIRVKFEKDALVANLENGIWSSDDLRLERILNSSISLFVTSPADPSRDLAIAEATINLFSGTIESLDSLPEHVQGRIY